MVRSAVFGLTATTVFPRHISMSDLSPIQTRVYIVYIPGDIVITHRWQPLVLKKEEKNTNLHAIKWDLYSSAQAGQKEELPRCMNKRALDTVKNQPGLSRVSLSAPTGSCQRIKDKDKAIRNKIRNGWKMKKQK